MKLKPEWQGTRFPPSGWPFTDGRTGMKFDPNAGDIRERTTQVLNHRRANLHIYPKDEEGGRFHDRASVAIEIEEFICNMRPELCDNGEIPRPAIDIVETPASTCVCGKVAWVAVLCPTCGGRKVQGYKCSNCSAPYKP